MDDKLSTDDFETNKNENKSDESYYIEKRYCTVCNLEQPIRSKHCKECKRCVAMYDHHVIYIFSIKNEGKRKLIFFY